MRNDDPFIVVTGKKNRKNKQKTFLTKNQNNSVPHLSTGIDTNRTLKIVQENIKDLEGSAIHTRIKDILGNQLKENRKKEFICFGLGSLSTYISRHQLALGVLLQKQVAPGSIKYFDPCFTVEDTQILEKFNIQVVPENLEGKYLSEDSYITIFYLPHCPKQLVNNLVWKNWGPRLKQLVLITNSFETILERTPSRLLQKSANYILKASRYITEFQLPEYTEATDIFNDLSVIVFDKLENVTAAIWEECSEPVYSEDDLELIRAS